MKHYIHIVYILWSISGDISLQNVNYSMVRAFEHPDNALDKTCATSLRHVNSHDSNITCATFDPQIQRKIELNFVYFIYYFIHYNLNNWQNIFGNTEALRFQ